VICAVFPTGDVAGFDMNGKQLWVRNVGPMDIQYGYVSSLALHDGRLILQHDRGGTDDQTSRLLLLEADSGKTVAEVVRTGTAGSWASPIVIPVGDRHQIVAQGQGMAIAHDAATGQELWRVESGVMDQSLSPIWTGRYVVLSDTGGGSIAVDPTGRGDLTGTDKVAWQVDGGNGPVSTPATDGKIIVQQDGWGGLTVLSAEDGRKLGELMLPEGAYDPSPAIAAGRVYQFTRKGHCHLIQLGQEPERVTTNKLIGGAGDRLLTSPAFAGDRIYVRSLKYLYCIGETP
jgi:outer membrane protein assembly factor BamB